MRQWRVLHSLVPASPTWYEYLGGPPLSWMTGTCVLTEWLPHGLLPLFIETGCQIWHALLQQGDSIKIRFVYSFPDIHIFSEDCTFSKSSHPAGLTGLSGIYPRCFSRLNWKSSLATSEASMDGVSVLIRLCTGVMKSHKTVSSLWNVRLAHSWWKRSPQEDGMFYCFALMEEGVFTSLVFGRPAPA